MIKKPTVALGIVAFLAVVFAICLVSAVHLLEPRGMAFGVTASSPVVDAVDKNGALDIKTYPSEDALMTAAEQGDIYGGYIVGSSSDTLVTVPAKSFFGEIFIRGGIEKAAAEQHQKITTTVVAPLPLSDRTGGVVGLLLLPTLMGGYLVASLLYSVTKSATARGRIGFVFSYAAIIALVTWLIAGPVLEAIPAGAVALVPAFFLVTAAVGLSAVALQVLVGPLGSLLTALLFVIIGGAGSGGAGVALLPTFWQTAGNLFPPRHAIELYRNVIYFGGHNVGLPILVLGLYAVASIVVIVVVGGRRSAASAGPVTVEDPAAKKARHRVVLIPAAFAFILTTLFALNYTSSGHSPVADNLPFGLVGSTQLTDAAQGPLLSLDVTTYPDEQAAMDAIERGEIYGALIASGKPAQLVVVPSISDIAPLDLTHAFETAAAEQHQKLTVKPYEPTALPSGDPYALVLATVLTALLVGGYMSASMLTNSSGRASGRWRGLWLAGFAVVTALAIDLAVTFLFQGIPVDAFWVTWAIMSLIIVVISWLTAVLRRLLGPVGVVLTLIVILQFGNPSSGGSNGAAYLPGFWNQIGPLLPPRNDFLLLRNTIYFGGNGIEQPLIVLLVYALIFGGVLAYLDWFRSPEPVIPGLKDEDTAGAAAVAIPVGPVA
ncbi:hypothetical protein LK09_14840 [Microbacterium mangrovi]|uniref:DUF3533 domain-containing protein n=1 Tax=Microbacterium mangrovi TaxID=1348253 RepID=A0A0B2A4S9_9MICO|nr:hypothetical protein [Microbacterium mangrovi]KHK96602.1 hypothetical protein LK09_14840 [Microbacterium mangrovi]